MKKEYFIKLLWVMLGTILLAMGVAFLKASSLGQDTLSAFIFSFMYLLNIDKLSYSFYYWAFNSLFLIILLIFDRKRVNLATIISLFVTTFALDFYLWLFGLLKMNTHPAFFRVIYGILGTVIVCIGIALYGGANIGIAPYDGLPFVLGKLFKKMSYKYIRMIIDFFFGFLGLIIGVIILKRGDIINVNTVLSFILSGPLIALFSKLFNKWIFKEEKETFD